MSPNDRGLEMDRFMDTEAQALLADIDEHAFVDAVSTELASPTAGDKCPYLGDARAIGTLSGERLRPVPDTSANTTGLRSGVYWLLAHKATLAVMLVVCAIFVGIMNALEDVGVLGRIKDLKNIEMPRIEMPGFIKNFGKHDNFRLLKSRGDATAKGDHALVTMTNNSGYDIYQLKFSTSEGKDWWDDYQLESNPSKDKEWWDDVLEGKHLTDGGTIILQKPQSIIDAYDSAKKTGGNMTVYLNVKIVFKSGKSLVYRKVKFPRETHEFTLKRDKRLYHK